MRTKIEFQLGGDEKSVFGFTSLLRQEEMDNCFKVSTNKRKENDHSGTSYVQ